MTLFHWVLVSTLAAMPTTPSVNRAVIAVEREAAPRVEIGKAVLTVYDASGKPVVVD
jgi:hypothetical protein